MNSLNTEKSQVSCLHIGGDDLSGGHHPCIMLMSGGQIPDLKLKELCDLRKVNSVSF